MLMVSPVLASGRDRFGPPRNSSTPPRDDRSSGLEGEAAVKCPGLSVR
jgi:hypothetical protein